MRYAILLLALLPLTARAEPAVARVSSGLTTLQVPLRSAMDLKRSGVVMQGFDYSCGAASMATLLSYGLDDPVDETWILKAVIDAANEGERALLTQKGLSLLDLQRIAEKRGHKAQGFRIGADQLAKLNRPVIVYIKPKGYEHFAVLKGVIGDRVYLADPSHGNVRMPLYRFFDMWADDRGRGVVFAVERKDGRWPDASLLGVTATAGPQLEQLTARELYDFGRLYPLTFPNSNLAR
jgi:predicted double-glycine peptidase